MSHGIVHGFADGDGRVFRDVPAEQPLDQTAFPYPGQNVVHGGFDHFRDRPFKFLIVQKTLAPQVRWQS
jgi:hypothetical protein